MLPRPGFLRAFFISNEPNGIHNLAFGMRWTNYFIHPGDNRYYVFSFAEPEHAEEYEEMLRTEEVPFERHEEDGQWLFGVPRSHFRKALHCNHLVHANHRTKFIPVDGLRYTLLVVTGAVLAVALVGALSASISAQGRVSDWELGVSISGVIPLEAVGYESIQANDEGLTLEWQPQTGSGFGLRLHRNFKSSTWSVETGLETLRMRSNWGLTFGSEISDGETADTLSLRAGRYRLPLLAQTKVPLNKRWALYAGGGVCIDFLLSDVFTTGYQQIGPIYHEYQVEENRQRRWTVPLRAEVGILYRGADTKKAGIYAGCIWWREWSTNRWGEAQWERDLEKANVRIFMPQAGFAFELRIILP